VSPEIDRDESLDREMEARLGQALRTLPERRAPATLESRVLDALARRVPLPWWRRSFAEWPAAARVAFGVTSAVLVVLTVLAAAAANANLGALGGSHALSTPVLHDASVFFDITRTLSVLLASSKIASPRSSVLRKRVSSSFNVSVISASARCSSG